MDIDERYQRWLERADPALQPALRAMTDPERQDAFSGGLRFGTAGLRGILGPGENRMNRHTVARASRGLAEYLGPGSSVVIGYDSRHGSAEFAGTAARVFAAAGVRVWLADRLAATPLVSFAVRALGCQAGVMITASHNPAGYNGYKVYGPDGGQITDAAAAAVQGCIDGVELFDGAPEAEEDRARAEGLLRPLPEEVRQAYQAAVLACSLPWGDDAPLVYSPLNGAGLEPVTAALTAAGHSRVFVVAEQADPDGDFPTCPRPNPELPEAMALTLRDARARGAALAFATDPDCDRIGAVIRDGEDERLLTGNQLGVLLLDYICRRRQAEGTLPDRPVAVTTIVSTPLVGEIAAWYGVELRLVLTGFKYIGEQLTLLERQGRAEDFILGFEESCGYLSGSHVRDKDGVNAAVLLSGMAGWYRARGESLSGRLAALEERFGCFLDRVETYDFPGAQGAAAMARQMAALRAAPPEALGGLAVEAVTDYAPGRKGLPPADVLEYALAEDARVIVRPSGTEPRLKVYLSVRARTRAEALALQMRLLRDLTARFG